MEEVGKDLKQEVLATFDNLRDILDLYVSWDKNKNTFYAYSKKAKLIISRKDLEGFNFYFGNFPALRPLRKLEFWSIRELLRFFVEAISADTFKIEKTEGSNEVIYTISYYGSKATIIRYSE